MGRLTSIKLIGLVVAAAASMFLASPIAAADPSATTHSIASGWGGAGITVLCFDKTGFSCAGGGYNGTSGQIGGNGWTTRQYWAWGSPAANGARHNCTTYAAYRLQVNGYAYPGWTANANGWDTSAWNANPRVDVNQVPAVAAIAQWNGGSAGHVAYVEAVTSSYIETTSDNYGGGTDHLRIALNSPYMPDNFIHFKDIVPSALVRAVATSDGHIQLFQVTNGVVEQNWYSPATGATGNWVSAAGMPGGVHAVGNPAVVPRPGQQVIDVFVSASDGLIRETWYNWGTGAWGGWIAISGATVTGDPQAVATTDGHDQIFADANGVVEQNWFSPATGATGNWQTI
jgi:hypothetical protein